MSTKLRIGQIPYLNCEPFFHGLALEGVELCPMPPSAMGPLAQAGELDAAPFSLVQSFGLEGRYEPLGDMGISVKGPVRSILFYSRVPMRELSGAVVGETRESATAVQLIRVLLEQRYKAPPREYVGLDDPRRDAFLLIGDEALVAPDRVEGFPYRYDLAEEWLKWKGLPFVFAVWMVRRTLTAEMKEMLADGVQKNLAENMEHNLKAIADKRESMNLAFEDVAGYLRAFRFVLAEEDKEAIGVFKRAWQLLPKAREVSR
ncbi:MAG: menaquinone biosynthesis protein [Chloroflexi bacterium]|nr:menaquinone biosynthesis protein [Chloroflexota bacterium]